MYRVGDGVSPPVARNIVEAEFPNDGRKRSHGVCLVSTIVDVDGKPLNPRVVYSAGAELDQKALEAVNKYKFTPSMLKGKAVPVLITIEVNFNP
jgi:protein TonB